MLIEVLVDWWRFMDRKSAANQSLLQHSTPQARDLSRGSMFFYRICDHTFRSNVPIPELVPGDYQQPEFTFQLRPETKDFSKSYPWLNRWYALDGSVWLAFARLEAGYLLRFPALADFVVSTDARTICGYLRAGCPPETMRHLLLNQVIPIVLSHLGKLVLHASACVTAHGAIAFMGVTGTGKSTLAASFGLQGCVVLTDDCLLVEEQEGQVITVPGYPGLRLWPETVSALFEGAPVLQPLAHYTEKKRLLLEQDYFDSSLLLKAVYVLAPPDDTRGITGVNIIPLRTGEALLETVKHTFQLDVTDRDKLGQAFRRYEWLAKSVKFFRLTFPREHAFLPAVKKAIFSHLDLIQNRQQIQN